MELAVQGAELCQRPGPCRDPKSSDPRPHVFFGILDKFLDLSVPPCQSHEDHVVSTSLGWQENEVTLVCEHQRAGLVHGKSPHTHVG